MGALGWYLDTSVLAALLRPEPSSNRADSFIRRNPADLTVSDFTAAEFASAVARWVRTRELNETAARTALESFDLWLTRSAQRVEVSPADIAAATTFLRRLDLPLRTPDAIHIAIAQRLGATLVTFDRRMAASAAALGTAVAMP
ncbi:MAG TPA: type II toxin-antitoxin system VapC family toxin [Stellaceae bacterium]|nr:type II toxin-antitoxin system VapC family toxin [Stellaceae bacterium]